jgi:uridine kinase
MKKLFSGKKGILFIGIIFIKIILLMFFSSDFSDSLFFPFVRTSIDQAGNPWDFYLSHGLSLNISPFPYPPVMLFILAPGAYCASAFASASPYLAALFFKLPLLLCDIVLFLLLRKMLFVNNKKLLVVYFLSPVILYAIYVHGQLDIIPTVFVFASIYCLMKEKHSFSALWLALAVGTKMHVLGCIPLIVIYLYRKKGWKILLQYLFVFIAAVSVIFVPVVFSSGFNYYVLSNEQQKKIFDSILLIGTYKLYLPVIATLIIYARFAIYRKTNFDLLLSFFGIWFMCAFFFIPPAPGWFVWCIPYLVVFFFRVKREEKIVSYVYYLLALVYLFFFIFCFIPEVPDIKFLGQVVDVKIGNEHIANIVYTILEATIACAIFALYRFGIKSNSVYQHEKAVVIGISGDSGSGKTTLRAMIMRIITAKKITEIEGDGDHRWERGDINWSKTTHLDPRANYLYRQAENLMKLKNRMPVYLTQYDHHSGKFNQNIYTEPRDYILLCGLHSFYLPISRKTIDLKIFVDTEERLRKHWKIVRDVKERGYSKKKILSQISSRLGDAKKYIHPQKKYADMLISFFTRDKFTVGDPAYSPKLLMKITVNSGLNLNEILNDKQIMDCVETYDFTEDLKYQFIVFRDEPNVSSAIMSIMSNSPSLIDIVGHNPDWADGFDGFIQLLVLLYLNNVWKIENEEV